MFTTATAKLIEFFQAAFQAGEVERDQQKYFNKYRSEIKAAGQLFQYLDLAKPDPKSLLGWKAKKGLLALIAETKAVPPQTTAKAADAFPPVLMDLMMDTMLGSDCQAVGSFCIHSLIKLGLVVEESSDDWMPTAIMLNLFTLSYYTRALAQARDPNALYEPVMSAE
jgi:hypothetical protein